jgi:hypothetical protein
VTKKKVTSAAAKRPLTHKAKSRRHR